MSSDKPADGTSQYRMFLTALALIMTVTTVVAMLRVSEVGVVSPWKIGAGGFGVSAALLVLRDAPGWVMTRV